MVVVLSKIAITRINIYWQSLFLKTNGCSRVNILRPTCCMLYLIDSALFITATFELAETAAKDIMVI